jgi:hypothetical protein
VLDYLVALGKPQEKPDRSDQVESFFAALARDQVTLRTLYAAMTLPVNEKTGLQLLRMFATGDRRSARRRGRRSAEVDIRPNVQAMAEYLDTMRNLPPPWPVSAPSPGDAPALAPAEVEPGSARSDAAGQDVPTSGRVDAA